MTSGDQLTSTRKISLTAGLLYLLTFVSIPTLFLYSSVRGANYIVGPRADTRVFIEARPLGSCRGGSMVSRCTKR